MTFLPAPMRNMLACAISLFACLASVPGIAQTTPAPARDTCAKPAWPPQSLLAEEEGTTSLSFLIGIDGVVRGTRVDRSSGHPLLDAAAQASLLRCRFSSVFAKAKPAGVWRSMQYVWMLDGLVRIPLLNASIREHAYLLKAKAADAIADPLQRCLAFPDFPGNEWPAGVAPATCHLMHDKTISLKQVADHLDRGALAELDAMFRRDLERHFATADFSEIIHRDLAQFDGGAEAGRLSATWLEKAPQSPFAHAARGAHLAALAWQARGDKAPQDMPKDEVQRMAALAVTAQEHFSKALSLEARLLPAHIGTVDMAALEGRKTVADAAFALAAGVDPACHPLNEQHLLALGPRAGGSVAAMEAYAKRLAPLLATRPLLALDMVLPAQEQGDVHYGVGEHAKVVTLLELAALAAPSPELFETLAMSRRVSTQDDRWATLVRLMAAYRFTNESFGAARTRGYLLLTLGEKKWALKSLRRAHELRPDDVQAGYMLGAGLYSVFDYARAGPFVSKGLADDQLRAEAQLTLGYIALYLGQLDKALQISTQFVTDYPKTERGWYLHGYIRMMQGAEQDALAGFGTFMRLVNRHDRSFAHDMTVAREYIKGDRSRFLAGPVGTRLEDDEPTASPLTPGSR